MSDVLHKWDGAFTHECHSISVEADTVASGTGCGGGGVEEQLALRDWWHSLTINTVTAVIIAVVSGVLPPAAVLWAYGLSFFKTTHQVPGWVILSSVAVAGLFMFIVGFNIRQWSKRRQAARGTLAIVAEGYPTSLWWHMGAVGSAAAMQVVGDFHITNLTPHTLTVPRTILVASYKLWWIVPRRLRIEGAGVYEAVPGDALTRDRFSWWIEPPILQAGRTLHAKVGLIDNLGRTNWGEWLEWKSDASK